MTEIGGGPAIGDNNVYPTVKVNITKVCNGYLVEPKDKHWNGVESVYLDLDSVLEEVRKNFS